MQSPLVTNVLLVVIAVLLLVMVIQNGMNSESSSSYRQVSVNNPHHAPMNQGRNPTVSPSSPMMGAAMFFQALRGFPEGCDNTRILAECSSPAAEAVKQEIAALAEQGQGPRQIFDYVINKYGMDALTQEAQQIRSMRSQ